MMWREDTWVRREPPPVAPRAPASARAEPAGQIGRSYLWRPECASCGWKGDRAEGYYRAVELAREHSCAVVAA